jgi:hypothetical protein
MLKKKQEDGYYHTESSLQLGQSVWRTSRTLSFCPSVSLALIFFFSFSLHTHTHLIMAQPSLFAVTVYYTIMARLSYICNLDTAQTI